MKMMKWLISVLTERYSTKVSSRLKPTRSRKTHTKSFSQVMVLHALGTLCKLLQLFVLILRKIISTWKLFSFL